MAAKTTLNAKNLEALGAERLSELLIEISTGDAHAKRRLRMELSGHDSPLRLAADIRKRLSAIGAAEAFVGWRSLKGFRADMQSQLGLITRTVESPAPAEALDLLWQFLSLGDGVLERTSDASGDLFALFGQACLDIGRVASVAAPSDLTVRTADALIHNSYGQADGLVAALAPALGEDGLRDLRARLTEAAKTAERATTRARRPSRGRRGRKLERDTLQRRPRIESLRVALEAIADALGDADAFAALQSDPKSLLSSQRVAERFLKSGKYEEALSALDQARGAVNDRPAEWTALRLQALDALGRSDQAQALRLTTFRRTLDAALLRAYLKRLPDFDDIEAEDAELDKVIDYPQAGKALDLLIGWPSPERAARLIMQRLHGFDGEDRMRLTLAADRLAGRYPAAAVRLSRLMTETTLAHGASAFYAEAAVQFWDSERLDAHLDDTSQLEPHDVWAKRLRDTYRRRPDFWRRIDGED